MSSNLCVESHLRELLEQGFEVVIVSNAAAGAKIPEGDGYAAALVNYRMLANAVWSTQEALQVIEQRLAIAAMYTDTCLWPRIMLGGATTITRPQGVRSD